jgi:hypothetical protein
MEVLSGVVICFHSTRTNQECADNLFVMYTLQAYVLYVDLSRAQEVLAQGCGLNKTMITCACDWDRVEKECIQITGGEIAYRTFTWKTKQKMGE